MLRRWLGLALVVGLWCVWAPEARAQVGVYVGGPYRGVSVGVPYPIYGGGYYPYSYYGYGYPYYGGYGLGTTGVTTYYSSGYSGLGSLYGSGYSPYSYGYGYSPYSYGYSYGYGYPIYGRGGLGRGFNLRGIGGFW